METIIQDLRYGLRLLRKHPGFTLVAVITLALGIGANTAIFSVINAVLLNPLPYQDSERLAMINHDYPQIQLKASVSAHGYRHYRDNARSFESVMAFTGWAANLTGQGEPERLAGMEVTPNFFSTLGAEPVQGRSFLPDEDQAGRNHVVVLSHGLWQRRFGGDPDLLNQIVLLNGERYTVVGIMPPHFEFGREIGMAVDLWRPIVFTDEQLSINRLTWEFLQVIARLRPGVSLSEAQSELDLMADNLRRESMPNADRSNWGLTIEPFYERLVGAIQTPLWILLGAVAFVLLIACTNVANLLLARGATREKEVAIRGALGAGRRRIARQLLTESTLLALIGGALGLLLAFWGVDLLGRLEQLRIPRMHEVRISGTVLGFTLAVCFLTGLLSGLVPALSRCDGNLHDSLKEGGRSGSPGLGPRTRGALVVLEVALALVLLIGAGLLLRSFLRLQRVDPGFQSHPVLTLHLSLPESKYRENEAVQNFYRELLEAIRALPGVESAGAVSILPLSGFSNSGSFAIEGRVVPSRESGPHGARWRVTPGYFETMRIRLLEGRFFTEQDTEDAPGVAIIDEELARKYWPDENPMGRRIAFEGSRESPRWREIVGIVGHVKHEGLDTENRAQYYIPQEQSPQRSMFLTVRTSGDPSALAGAVRGSIRRLDSDLPVARVFTMERVLADSMVLRRFSTFLLGIFAAVAIVLALVGIYGVTSYAIAQRTHEVGVRMAMGAARNHVLALVVGQGMILVLTGVVIGLAGAFALTRFMSGILFGITPTDAATFSAVPLLLVLVALLACYIPAHRAARVDPMVALRYE